MNSFLQQLSDRERFVVLGGGGVIALLVLFQFILVPIFDWRSGRARAADSAENTYDLVVEAAARGAPVEQAGDPSRPVRNIISETAQGASVELTYVNVGTDGRVDATVSNADPAAFFNWVATLEREHGVTVTTADITRERGATNRVRATMSFARSGG